MTSIFDINNEELCKKKNNQRKPSRRKMIDPEFPSRVILGNFIMLQKQWDVWRSFSNK